MNKSYASGTANIRVGVPRELDPVSATVEPQAATTDTTPAGGASGAGGGAGGAGGAGGGSRGGGSRAAAGGANGAGSAGGAHRPAGEGELRQMVQEGFAMLNRSMTSLGEDLARLEGEVRNVASKVGAISGPRAD